MEFKTICVHQSNPLKSVIAIRSIPTLDSKTFVPSAIIDQGDELIYRKINPYSLMTIFSILSPGRISSTISTPSTTLPKTV